jgi:hypothetical protein
VEFGSERIEKESALGVTEMTAATKVMKIKPLMTTRVSD